MKRGGRSRTVDRRPIGTRRLHWRGEAPSASCPQHLGLQTKRVGTCGQALVLCCGIAVFWCGVECVDGRGMWCQCGVDECESGLRCGYGADVVVVKRMWCWMWVCLWM